MTRVAVSVEGWSAEAAIAFALAARKYDATVTLTRGSETVDGKDGIDVMTLAPGPGEEVVMAVEGTDEKEAFDALLAKLLSVIEPPRDRLAEVLGSAATHKRPGRPRLRRAAEVAALDVEEVAPIRPRRTTKPKPAPRRRRPRKRKK